MCDLPGVFLWVEDALAAGRLLGEYALFAQICITSRTAKGKLPLNPPNNSAVVVKFVTQTGD
jgi:hypothetical protein